MKEILAGNDVPLKLQPLTFLYIDDREYISIGERKRGAT